ncbi:MAG TPA: hypothetical protein VNB64_11135, partial [Solirubrobacteraceae bacterium]|nr:hypothetical protein [Solirubrobacteraceae bacterium]
MRLAALIAALAAVLAAPAGAAMSGGPAGAADARARLASCHAALDPLARSLTVDSYMLSLRGGDHMQMRFELWQRAAGSLRFRRLPGPGLGTWNSATEGVQRFRFRKPIENLPAPASYFVRVHYRWRSDAGRTFAAAVRSTRLCHQPDVRADLRIAAVGTPRRVGPNRFAYPVVVHNRGRAASGGFDAVLAV